MTDVIHYKNTDIKTDPFVYEPSEDSFLLLEAALSEIRSPENVLEVGCGSGIISAVIKANTNARVIAIDINPYAASCTRDNGVDVITGDLLGCIKGKFDLIIFNPPYLPTDESERTDDWINTALDGGRDGRRMIRRFLEEALDRLTEKGRILILISSFTGIEEVKSMMKSLGYEFKEKKKERYSFEELLVIACAKMRK